MRSEKRIVPFLAYIEEQWLKHPDMRFGQLLINLGLVEDGIRTWNLELTDYGLTHEYIRGIQTWGTNGKGGREDYKELYIKDLEEDHIKAIIKTQTHISEALEKVLKDELKFREDT